MYKFAYLNECHVLKQHSIYFVIHLYWMSRRNGNSEISGVGEMGQIISETGVGETGTSRQTLF